MVVYFKINNFMERIVLEVDEQASKAYNSLGQEKQQQLLEAVSILLKKATNDATADEYRKLLDEFGGVAVRNGLTQEVLDGLLSKHD